MNIGVVGLGLIGGSMAKTIKAKTAHAVFGFDNSDAVQNAALQQGAIDGVLDEASLSKCDLVIVALYPKAAVEYVLSRARFIGPETVVVDCCGVKRHVCDSLRAAAKQSGFVFVGGHPMAGTERWGFESARENLFEGASMIVAPEQTTPDWAMQRIRDVFLGMGFSRIQLCTPKEHDLIIAYTSQLAHVVSCSYIADASAKRAVGFSAGSFRDMTRVAYLNETMWAELFIENADFLTNEVDAMIGRLKSYSDALKAGDKERLEGLLKNSRETKQTIDALYKGAAR